MPLPVYLAGLPCVLRAGRSILVKFDGNAIRVIAPHLPAMVRSKFRRLVIDLVIVQALARGLDIVHL